MATSSKKTSLAYQQLSKTLGAKPPAELDTLAAADLKQLADAVDVAYANHMQAMGEAEESIINTAPRPLRGAVRKILGV
jgi:hypothetical protein